MKKFAFATAALTIALSGNAFALETNNGTIEFTGTVNNDTCSVVSQGGSNAVINVAMGSVSLDDIGTATNPKLINSSSSDVALDITCKSVGKVNMAFAALGGNLESSNTVLKLATGSTATGVGVAVYPTGSTTPMNLLNGSLIQDQTIAAGGTYKTSFSAAYVQATGVQAAGSANASLPFVLTYE